MTQFSPQHCNLNIHYNLPKKVWNKMPKVYKQLPGWKGWSKEGIPHWFGYDHDEVSISASVEPSGLQLSGNLDAEVFEVWIATFKQIATNVLGFEVTEPELQTNQ
ncbi:hypothetical protein [uncultured Microscilla sp.]|uniref:hypothetical protein n=1 Tax=uncultured Microscilla sp. TaxID=432653 RepID=UPI002621398A|nr:hypothetical protein [uncultured Microscilla sp.]